MELHNELGCLDKDWANYIAQHSSAKITEYFGLLERSDEEFRKADNIAASELLVQKADNLEDWTWLYHLRYAYRNTMKEEAPEDLLRAAVGMLDKSESLLERSKDRPERGWKLTALPWQDILPARPNASEIQ